MNFKVGEIWRTRDAKNIFEVYAFWPNQNYPMRCKIPGQNIDFGFTLAGRYILSEPSHLDLVVRVSPAPDELSTAQPEAPTKDCECHKEKFGFMTHERWCPDYISLRTMLTKIELVPAPNPCLTAADQKQIAFDKAAKK